MIYVKKIVRYYLRMVLMGFYSKKVMCNLVFNRIKKDTIVVDELVDVKWIEGKLDERIYLFKIFFNVFLMWWDYIFGKFKKRNLDR